MYIDIPLKPKIVHIGISLKPQLVDIGIQPKIVHMARSPTPKIMHMASSPTHHILHIAPHVTGPVKETLVVSAAGKHDPRQSKSEGGKLWNAQETKVIDDLKATCKVGITTKSIKAA